MTDTKHSKPEFSKFATLEEYQEALVDWMQDQNEAQEREAFEKSRPPRTDLAIKRGKYSNPVVQKCWETWQARAAIAAAAPAGEPVMWYEAEESARGADIRNVIGGMLFSTRIHHKRPETSNPVWPLYAAPVPAAAPKAALTLGQISELAAEHLAWDGRDLSKLIAFARAIDAASGPNAALATALEQLIEHCDNVGTCGMAIEDARAALAAAGVKP